MGVLDDKVAIVSGSARGIGRATAELLSEHGARVVINDLDGDAAAQTASEIAGDTVVHAGDLTKPGAPDDARADGDRRMGPARHHRQQRRLHDRRRRSTSSPTTRSSACSTSTPSSPSA